MFIMTRRIKVQEQMHKKLASWKKYKDSDANDKKFISNYMSKMNKNKK